MIRRLLSVILVAAFAAVVGAQGPKTLLPQQRAELYKKNRPMIEGLVKKTVESSRTPNDHLKRADSYYQVLFDFSREITAARKAKDTERVEELTKLLQKLLDDGLRPTLADARRQVENGTGAEDYQRVRDNLLTQVNLLLADLNDDASAKKSLESARDNLNAISGPKKK
jgi:hypothetical protein